MDILNTTKQRFTLDDKLLLKIKDRILGRHFELSLVIIGDKKSRTLNKTFRNKDKTANILSFSLDKDIGEIFLNIKKASIESVEFEMKPKDFLYYLIIHSMLHLKDFKHGEAMEKEEQKILKEFNIGN